MNRKSGLAIAGAGLAAALGVTAWQRATAETWAGVMLLTTCGVLMLSAIAAVCGRSDLRPRFGGFAVFGWGYFALARWYTYHQGPGPMLRWLVRSRDVNNDFLSLAPTMRIVNDAWALAFAVFGSILAEVLFKRYSAHEPERGGEMLASGDPNGWWREPALVGLSGFGLVTVAAVLADRRWEAEAWAGAAFFLTSALLGLAILGAVCGGGRRREAWIGAASFGIGYFILAFSSLLATDLPTSHLVNAVFRPGGPPTGAEWPDDELTTDDESRRVRQVLQEPIAVHFPEETSLKVVLESIKNAIRPSLGKDLVLCVSSVSPAYNRRTLDQSVVTIDRVNIPANDALRLCLGQCGLTCRVQSGYVRIVPDAYQPLPFEEDPVMIAGHSVLALVAAALGGLGAVVVGGLLGRHRPNG